MKINIFLVCVLLVVGQLSGRADEAQLKTEQCSNAAKLPLPDDDEREKALATIRQVFDKDYRDRKIESQRALERKLLKQADDPANAVVMQYALLTEAARIAAEAGDVQAALDAVEKIALRFNDDELSLKLNILSVASKAKAGSDSLKQLIDQWICLANEAVSAELFDLAKNATRSACGVAIKTGNKELIYWTGKEQQRIKASANLYAAMLEGWAKLVAKPNDPEANSAIGQYMCFVEDRWDDGIIYLSKGDQAELKTVAELELAKPESAQLQVELADKWQQMAEQEKNILHETAFQSRAWHWFNSALPMLAGIDRVKVETKLEAIRTSKNTGYEVRKDIKPIRTRVKKSVYLDDIQPIAYQVGHGKLATHGDGPNEGSRCLVNGAVPAHSVCTHPPANGFSYVNYSPDGKYKTFHATVTLGGVAASRSPLTFIVLGDGIVLWESKPVQGPGEFDICSINVRKVQALSLHVCCPGQNSWAWALWVDPVLTK